MTSIIEELPPFQQNMRNYNSAVVLDALDCTGELKWPECIIYVIELHTEQSKHL